MRQHLRRLIANPLTVTVLLAQAVFGLLWLTVWSGSLQWAELVIYDSIIAELPAATAEAAVVLVGGSDKDVEALNWPLTDELLANLLESILRGEPKAVGVDLYRSEPRPPGNEKLTAILNASDRVFMAYKFPEGSNPGIPAPKAARETGQIGFTDLVLDPGGVIRRALLFLTDASGQTGLSLALQLANRALADTGVCLQSDGTDANNTAFGPCSAPDPTPATSAAPLRVIAPIEQDHGGYANADTGGYQVMLDYRSGFHPFRMVNMQDVLAGRTPTGLFKDRVVILGAAAESVKDFFFTPFSRLAALDQPSFGMEIHGQLVAQLLRIADGRATATRSLSAAQKALWAWLWCMLGAALGYRIRSPWKFAARGIAGAVVIFLIGYIGLTAYLWMPVAAPLVGWLVSAALTTSLMSYQEQRDRNALMGLFSSHVSAGVAEEMWSQRAEFMDGNRPRPQRLMATVLFSDLRGFTSISEGLDPEELMAWLNEYMATMSSVISLHAGVIDKFIGDAIMVVFGIPKKRESDAEIAADAKSAVMCAVAMAHELDALNAKWRRENKSEIGMRVGVHTGLVVAGALGGAERMNYTVIGDTVNIAARLESFDKAVVDPARPDAACRIIISETTRAQLGDKFTTLRIGELPLKGKQHAVEAHLVRVTKAQ